MSRRLQSPRHATRRLVATLLAIALPALAACGGSSSSHAKKQASPLPEYTAPPATLPAVPVQLSTAPAPWLPPALISQGAQSATYVEAAGFSNAPEEMLAVHYHAHLDVVVNGKKVTVPPYIGFVAKGTRVTGLAPLHTHDATGLVHIENSVPAKFILGQVFVEWGVRFTPTCLGGYCSGNGKQLAVFVNGKRYAGDPTQIVLANHQEIAVEYGPSGRLPKPPSSYRF